MTDTDHNANSAAVLVTLKPYPLDEINDKMDFILKRWRQYVRSESDCDSNIGMWPAESTRLRSIHIQDRLSFFLSGESGSLEAILAAARSQPESIEPGLVEDDSDSDSSDESKEASSAAAPVKEEELGEAKVVSAADGGDDSSSSSSDNEADSGENDDGFTFVKKEVTIVHSQL